MSDSLVERLRKHALPDPHDEREVMHAPLLREAASALEGLQAENERLKQEQCELCDMPLSKMAWLVCFECYSSLSREYLAFRAQATPVHQASASSDASKLDKPRTAAAPEQLAAARRDNEGAGLARQRELGKATPVRSPSPEIDAIVTPAMDMDGMKLLVRFDELARAARRMEVARNDAYERAANVANAVMEEHRARSNTWPDTGAAALANVSAQAAKKIRDRIRALRDTAPVGSQGGDDSGCGHDHGVER